MSMIILPNMGVLIGGSPKGVKPHLFIISPKIRLLEAPPHPPLLLLQQ
ncbi:MAG: hypothetical protein AAFU41_12045 [Pseudomonadota bacterium]